MLCGAVHINALNRIIRSICEVYASSTTVTRMYKEQSCCMACQFKNDIVYLRRCKWDMETHSKWRHPELSASSLTHSYSDASRTRINAYRTQGRPHLVSLTSEADSTRHCLPELSGSSGGCFCQRKLCACRASPAATQRLSADLPPPSSGTVSEGESVG